MPDRISSSVVSRIMVMTESKTRFDIFVCGGSQHVELLKPLLQRLLPHGTVHLASSFLREEDLQQLHARYDVLHRPAHSLDGYVNFELFCIKDINRLATAPYFIKLDADVTLSENWNEYVEACIATHPEAVLMGPWKGDVDIDVELSGALIRQLLHRDVHVKNGLKVIGGFYLARTAFFKERIWLMDFLHRCVLSSQDGGAAPARVAGNDGRLRGRECRDQIVLRGRFGKAGSPCSEDTLRSFLVHAVDAHDRAHVIDSRGRIRLDR